MATNKAEAEVTLRLERRIAARPEQVWAAWTKPEAVARWFSPTPDYTVHVHALEVRPGGRYRIEMVHVGGNSSVASGMYREVEAPNRLVFTWQWEDKPQVHDTIVTVRFEPDGAGTRLLLLHERFIEAADRDKHQQGWLGCLSRLDTTLASS